MIWHNCNGEIGDFLRKAVSPAKSFNGGRSTWFVMVVHRSIAQPLAVKYCPVCGELLPPIEQERGG